ncbi:DUF3017 domain-containing protein [Streptomyces sp. MBT42]|uniref:DUF3017 domain-containing protein n=1 Tax=Streptomyces sp. MBT42 TaxID=1488373 RepID=UPI001E4DAE8F|nr:DUF3017 domain-containing protein [Streptomyces sp. MBT42]MCD2464911.1 DUF3017 domain-containing protein [Streptomyces sp. MBT42]
MTPGTPGAAGNPDGPADGPSKNGSAGASGPGASGSDAASPRASGSGASGSGASTGGAAGGAASNGAASNGAASNGAGSGGAASNGAAPTEITAWKRPAPILTTDTARPEGGGRAAPSDAPAPARQWPLLTVLGLAGLGLLVVGTDAFWQSFRIGTMLVGAALLVGAVLRRVMPSVGMLAVRSRFTDMITYGVMGGLIVLLALMVQPKPWLKIPFLEDILHLTVT